jgi:competence protein ComEC
MNKIESFGKLFYFNIRTFFVSFIEIILTILSVYLFYIKDYLLFTFDILFLLSFLLYFFANKKFYILIFASIFIVLSLFSTIFSLYNKFLNFDFNNSELVTIIGRIESVNDSTAILSDCDIRSIESNRNVKSKKVLININFGVGFEMGDRVSLACPIYRMELFRYNNLNSYLYKYNIKYYVDVFTSNIQNVQSGKLFIDEKVRKFVLDKLNSSMSEDSSSLSYASLFGDKQFISYDIKQNFYSLGIAHILAVSGLHIGIIVVILNYILNKLKVNKKISFVSIFVILVFYCYLCGFSPSVVRASIMSLTLIFSNLIGEKNDILNTISFTGCLILLISPFMIFDIGFELSFSCVFGIILLNSMFKSLMDKLNIKSKILYALSISLSAQLMMLPFISLYFHKISLIGLLLNIFIIPLFTFTFIFLIIGVFFSIIHINFILYFTDILFNFMKISADFFANNFHYFIYIIPFGLIGIIAYYLMSFIISHKFFAKNRIKLLILSSFLIIFILSIIITNLPIIDNKTYISSIYGLNGESDLLSSDGDNYLVNIGKGNDYDINLIKNFLIDKNIKKINAFVIINESNIQTYDIIDIINIYAVDKIFISNYVSFDECIKNKISDKLININDNNDIVYKNIKFNLTNYSKHFALNVLLKNYKLSFISPYFTENNFDELKNGFAPNLVIYKSLNDTIKQQINSGLKFLINDYVDYNAQNLVYVNKYSYLTYLLKE